MSAGMQRNRVTPDSLLLSNCELQLVLKWRQQNASHLQRLSPWPAAILITGDAAQLCWSLGITPLDILLSSHFKLGFKNWYDTIPLWQLVNRQAMVAVINWHLQLGRFWSLCSPYIVIKAGVAQSWSFWPMQFWFMSVKQCIENNEHLMGNNDLSVSQV